jgi:glycosyltransferase involved in cell wall biosynthesis
MERAVVHHADRVVCVTPFMTQWYRARYPEEPSYHWETITNGFSAGEFEADSKIPLSAKFTISYLGSIEYERTPELVFQALRDLCQEGLMKREEVEIRLVGKCHEVHGCPMTDLIATYELGDIVTMVGSVPRHEALREMRQAHVLLLLATNQKLQTPGKAYEYIGAGRRILAITEPEWSTADVVRSMGGAVVAQGDIREMKRVLEAWYGEYRCGLNTQVKPLELGAKAAEFEWSRLGTRYAQVLSSVC